MTDQVDKHYRSDKIMNLYNFSNDLYNMVTVITVISITFLHTRILIFMYNTSQNSKI